MAKKRIHVNQHVIRANIRDDDVSPPITVKHRKNNYYGSRVEVLGPSVLIYSPKKPLLSCGARLILECGGIPDIKENYRAIDGALFSGVVCEDCNLVALHFSTQSGINLWNEMVLEWID